MRPPWNLDDPTQFVRVLAIRLPWAHTWADTRKGKTDRERRERLRGAAIGQVQAIPANAVWWGFRIIVRKAGQRPFDIENVPKIIVDAFCARQIAKDDSEFAELGLYPDDSIDHVRLLHVFGERSREGDSTVIELFAFVGNGHSDRG